MIKIKNLVKEYRDEGIATTALNGLNFEVKPGEFIAITGPSGSGKSTLMHILGLLDRPTGGQYILEGHDTATLSDIELARLRNKKLGFVFQSFNLLRKTTVLENIKLPLNYAGEIKNQDANYLAEMAIAAVNMQHRKTHFPNQLSGGEQQRVAIARALINNPSIIMADEPTGNLDTKNSIQIMDIFVDLNKKGQTVILVTHEDMIADYARRVIQMKDGKIVSDKTRNN